MAVTKYYMAAGLQPSKDTDNEYTGASKYSMCAGVPKIAESAGGGPTAGKTPIHLLAAGRTA